MLSLDSISSCPAIQDIALEELSRVSVWRQDMGSQSLSPTPPLLNLRTRRKESYVRHSEGKWDLHQFGPDFCSALRGYWVLPCDFYPMHLTSPGDPLLWWGTYQKYGRREAGRQTRPFSAELNFSSLKQKSKSHLLYMHGCSQVLQTV